mgnify:FL=1
MLVESETRLQSFPDGRPTYCVICHFAVIASLIGTAPVKEAMTGCLPKDNWHPRSLATILQCAAPLFGGLGDGQRPSYGEIDGYYGTD